MLHIRPFRGVLYNPHKIKDFAQVVTEPYDVISPAQQKAYYEAHLYNIIRLILGKRYSKDNRRNNQYTRARKFFADWLRKDILRCDNRKSLYIYAQTFAHNNRRRTRTGFIVLLKLEDFSKNVILPHENTFFQHVQDRLNLLQAVEANLSPIFAMFIDQQGKINRVLGRHKAGRRPYINVEKDRVLHRIWRLSDKRKIRTIQRLLKGHQIFIADGHHRYEAALHYKIKMQRKRKPLQTTAKFNYVMTYLVATDDPGLTILPTHRVIKGLRNFNLRALISNLTRTFEVHKFSTSGELFSYLCARRRLSGCVFGAYFGKNRFFALKLRKPKKASSRKRLDVDVLHNLVIERLDSNKYIYYTRDAQEAIKLVEEGRYQGAFLLRPTTIMQVRRMAEAGKRMPHKSTYFYPKLLTGLAINRLNQDDSQRTY